MLVIAYGILALMGVGVYVLGFCFFELNKRNEIAAEANEINGRVASALEALNDTYESSQPGYHEDTAV